MTRALSTTIITYHNNINNNNNNNNNNDNDNDNNNNDNISYELWI